MEVSLPVRDHVNAFCKHGFEDRQTREDGLLSGLTFAIKDAFDVAGIPTGAGNPEWLVSHAIPKQSAPIVDILLNAGGRMVGKTRMDEMAWSLIGKNAHYGTPINAAAPDRVPGGSSSGSASATAAGLVDFAIGSDTGGSVRLPASFCGIYGIRPTHGRISLAGGVPLAPSYDTVGWFASNAAILDRVGAVLLGAARAPRPTKNLIIAQDLFTVAGEASARALWPHVEKLSQRIGSVSRIDIAASKLEGWGDTFRIVQSSEVWAAHGDWVNEVKPKFGPGVCDRFAAASMIAAAETTKALSRRDEIRARMHELVQNDTIIVLPTSPGIAPLRNATDAELQEFRVKAVQLLCPAGHAGLPQISLPLAMLDGCPLGISLIAGRNCDEDLLQLAKEIGTDY